MTTPTFIPVRTASDLKWNVGKARPGSQFFSRTNMKFAGDTMRNYGVRQATVESIDGSRVACWELYRRNPVKHGLTASAYFCRETFEQVFPRN